MQTLLLIFSNLSIFLEDFLKFSSAIFYNLPVCPFEFVFLFLYLSSSFVFPHQPLLFPPVLRNIPYSETETTLLFFVTECAALAHNRKYMTRRCVWNRRGSSDKYYVRFAIVSYVWTQDSWSSTRHFCMSVIVSSSSHLEYIKTRRFLSIAGVPNFCFVIKNMVHLTYL